MSSIGATRDAVQKCFAILVLVMAPGIALAQQHHDNHAGSAAPPPPQHSAPPPQHSAPPPSNNNRGGGSGGSNSGGAGGAGHTNTGGTGHTNTGGSSSNPYGSYGNRGSTNSTAGGAAGGGNASHGSNPYGTYGSRPAGNSSTAGGATGGTHGGSKRQSREPPSDRNISGTEEPRIRREALETATEEPMTASGAGGTHGSEQFDLPAGHTVAQQFAQWRDARWHQFARTAERMAARTTPRTLTAGTAASITTAAAPIPSAATAAARRTQLCTAETRMPRTDSLRRREATASPATMAPAWITTGPASLPASRREMARQRDMILGATSAPFAPAA